MRICQGERDVGGDHRVLAVELVDEGSVASEPRHRASSGLSSAERLPKDFVHESPGIPQNDEEGRRELPREGKSDRAMDGGHPASRELRPEKGGPVREISTMRPEVSLK
jgi:hypothetical protein